MRGALPEPLADHLRQRGLLPDEERLAADVVGDAAVDFMWSVYLKGEDARDSASDLAGAMSEEDWRNEWRCRLRNYDSGKGWPPNVFGPPPEHPMTRVPSDLLAEWRARRAA